MSGTMAGTEAGAGPSRIFLSYSHEDRREKDALMVQLAPLERQSLISTWSDEDIGPGEEWLKAIDRALDSAAVGVLLVSANFLASEFIQSREVPKLLQRHASNTVIYPIIIKPCAWRAIDWLSRLQVRPRNGEPVWRDNGRFAEQELAEIAYDLARIAERRMVHPVSSGPTQSGQQVSASAADAVLIDFGELKRQAVAAIRGGAPEYNRGDIAACARRYAQVVILVQKHGIRGATSAQLEDVRGMGDGPRSMPDGRRSMPDRRRQGSIDANMFLSPGLTAGITELYRAVGSIGPDSSAEDLDYFAWQARYCFDRTLDVSDVVDLAADMLNNPCLQLRDIQQVFQRVDRAISGIYWPDWPQKLTSIDSGIKLVASLLSSVIICFRSAGILEGRAELPVAAASALDFVVRECDEARDDPYRLSWILRSFMTSFARGA
jgi:hypothetical protein